MNDTDYYIVIDSQLNDERYLGGGHERFRLRQPRLGFHHLLRKLELLVDQSTASEPLRHHVLHLLNLIRIEELSLHLPCY